MRVEGEKLAAYYAISHAQKDATFLGSIRLAAVKSNTTRKQAFISMMSDMASDRIAGRA